jgi:mannose-6-phosphate isomerase-like protein (cupin superfamily)
MHFIPDRAGRKVARLLLILLLAPSLWAESHKTDPTWLHRYLAGVGTALPSGSSSEPCHYQPLFGQGDPEASSLRSVTRFGELRVAAHANCPDAIASREEECLFVLNGSGVIEYESQSHAIRRDDFTYLHPDLKHAFRNTAEGPLRLIVMGFRIPTKVGITATAPPPKILNLDDVKEELVNGHPSSVEYKLMAGPRTGKRDAIDDAYVMTSLFLMDFVPGGTNWPHHHETAEEIYLVLDGEGDIVAGSGIDGVEGRFPAKAGDAYFFRANCTVGFYNQNRPGAKAHILAVRSLIPLPTEID